MKDLTLVPIDTLIQEIFNRTQGCILAYVREEKADQPEVRCHWHGENIPELIGLASFIGAEIYNNSNGEMI